MIDSDSRLLPVFEGQELVGVVTVDDILRKVEPFLDAATVAEAHSADLVSIGPATTLETHSMSFVRITSRTFRSSRGTKQSVSSASTT